MNIKESWEWWKPSIVVLMEGTSEHVLEGIPLVLSRVEPRK